MNLLKNAVNPNNDLKSFTFLGILSSEAVLFTPPLCSCLGLMNDNPESSSCTSSRWYHGSSTRKKYKVRDVTLVECSLTDEDVEGEAGG